MTLPIILTLPTGEKRRFNPFQILGWRTAEVPLEGGRTIMGTSVIMPGGPVGVIESEAQIDWLFAIATGSRPHDPVGMAPVEVPPHVAEAPPATPQRTTRRRT